MNDKIASFRIEVTKTQHSNWMTKHSYRFCCERFVDILGDSFFFFCAKIAINQSVTVWIRYFLSVFFFFFHRMFRLCHSFRSFINKTNKSAQVDNMKHCAMCNHKLKPSSNLVRARMCDSCFIYYMNIGIFLFDCGYQRLKHE